MQKKWPGSSRILVIDNKSDTFSIFSKNIIFIMAISAAKAKPTPTLVVIIFFLSGPIMPIERDLSTTLDRGIMEARAIIAFSLLHKF